MSRTSPSLSSPRRSWLLAATLLAACSAPAARIASNQPVGSTPPELSEEPDPALRFELSADCEAPTRTATVAADAAHCPLECPAGARDEQGCCPDPGAADVAERACRACDPWACLQRVAAFTHAIGGPRDEDRARTYRNRAVLLLDQGCVQGVAQACLDAARLHLQDQAFDVSNPWKQEERACSIGSQRACFLVGTRLLLGDRPDEGTRGMALLTTACASGLGAACTHAAAVLDQSNTAYNVESIPVDAARAAKLYRAACDLGDGDGCMKLSFLHGAGLGGAKSRSLEQEARGRAISRLEFQCAHGDGHACLYASMFYELGKGVPLWPERVRELREMACNAGTEAACRGSEVASAP